MNRFFSLTTFSVLMLLAFGQVRIPGPGGEAPAASFQTPTIVNESSWNSTHGSSVTTRVAGTVTCANYTDCIPLADPALSGNLIGAYGTFARSTVITPTVTDDKSDAGTCAAGSTSEASPRSTNEWPYICWIPNATSGAHLIEVTFGTSAVTEVIGKTFQFYNVATSSPLDGSVVSCGAASATTANCLSAIVPTQSDLVFTAVFRAGTPLTDKFTSGGSATLSQVPDINDGSAGEYQVTSGSVTPTMIMATSSGSTYLMIAAAFKASAAIAGTAPSGEYARAMESYSTVSPTTEGTIAFQFLNDSGALLAETNSCNTITVSSVTDLTNTWTTTANKALSFNNVNESYSANSTANATGAISLVTSGTGDCTHKFYAFDGAPTSIVVSRAQWDDNCSGVDFGFASGVQTMYSTNVDTGGGFCSIGKYLPAATTGVTLFIGGQNDNTTLSVNGMSPCIEDVSTQGGESLSGPWSIDQNNAFAHCIASAKALSSIPAWNETSSSTSPSGFSLDAISFFGGSGGDAIVNTTPCETGTAATFLACTIPAPTSGNLMAFSVEVYNSTARTATHVCVGGNSTCSTGTAATELSSSVSTGSGHGATSTWMLTSAPSGSPTTVDLVASASASQLEITVYEVQKASGSWAIDGNGAHTSGGTGSGTTITAPSFTPASFPSFCISNIAVNNNVTNPIGPSSPLFYSGNIFSATSNDGSAAGFINSGAVAAKFTDGSSGDGFSGSIGCAE